jgi:hypothetical protein
MYAKKLIRSISLADTVISSIKKREGLGLRFILDCLKAWILRDKQKKV